MYPQRIEHPWCQRVPSPSVPGKTVRPFPQKHVSVVCGLKRPNSRGPDEPRPFRPPLEDALACTTPPLHSPHPRVFSWRARAVTRTTAAEHCPIAVCTLLLYCRVVPRGLGSQSRMAGHHASGWGGVWRCPVVPFQTLAALPSGSQFCTSNTPYPISRACSSFL